MHFCKNCLQQYSQPQINQNGQAICPVKGCGADHPRNTYWPENINARNANNNTSSQEHLKMLFSLINVPYIDVWESENRSEITDKLQVVKDAPLFWRIICANETEDSDVLKLLARDPERAVREAAERNPSTPAEALAELARDPDAVVE